MRAVENTEDIIEAATLKIGVVGIERTEAFARARDRHIENARRLIGIAAAFNASPYASRRRRTFEALCQAGERVTAAKTCAIILGSLGTPGWPGGSRPDDDLNEEIEILKGFLTQKPRPSRDPIDDEIPF